MIQYRIGIDLGGTKIEGILLDEKNTPLQRKRIPTLQGNGYESIVHRITELINELRDNLDTGLSIGIGTPGTISPETGKMRNSNTQCLKGQPLKSDLEAALGTTIKLANDANCFAVAEATLGAARNHNVVFGVIMGTGVGGGIVINGVARNGLNYIAGEWGHNILYPDGLPCYCGKKGCIEKYLSGPALTKRWAELTGENRPLKEIMTNGAETNSDAFQTWKDEFIENYGIALSGIINLLDPDAIVLGGGLSNISFLYSEGEEAVKKFVFSETVKTPILKNELGDSAGVFGAALL